MKTCKHVIPIVLAMLLPACQHQMVPEVPALVEHTLFASTPGEESPATRTMLDSGNDRKVLWSAGGEIISILPAAGGNYQFQGDNVEAASTASFTGEGPADLGNYVALYPYSLSASYDGTYVSSTLPVNQSGKAGSFADGYLITADDASGNSISFNHMCSGLRFQVNNDNIKAVSIRGNSGEKIAGSFRFSFPSADTPVAQDATEDFVTLTAPGGGSFETGKYYYIVVLPTTFSKGFTLTADNGTQVGELRFNSSITFTAGTFKNITGNLNERMSWSTPKSQTYYGSQNTLCLRPGHTLRIDVLPRMIYGAWQRSGIVSAGATHATSREILWQDGTAISASLEYDRLTITAGNAEGTALVAIKNGTTIIWSYLIWVTASAPAETTLPSGAVAMSTLGGNLYFQWGRKDPLQAGYGETGNQGDDGLSYSISHPEEYINGVLPTNNWYTGVTDHADNDLWGGVSGKKTVWDPCPQGWRIPSEADFTDLPDKDSDYGFADGYYFASNPLKQGDVYSVASCLSVSYYPKGQPNPYYVYEVTGDRRDGANFIRCVKE